MRDKRLTILLTAEERETVDRLAERMGVSSSALVRDLVEAFENLSPDEEAELSSVLAQFNEAVPTLFSSLDRIEAKVAGINDSISELRQQIETTSDRVARIENVIEGGALALNGHIVPAEYPEAKAK